MKSATRIITATFGSLAALAGLEHGIGEVLQGNVAPAGIVFESWPDSAFFRVLAGEPAMSLVPNLLLSGVLTIVVSVAFFSHATLFADRKRSGLVLMLLSGVWLLVGGGFGPPLLGIIVGSAAALMQKPRATMKKGDAVRAARYLAILWPWCFGACLLAWLYLLPGTAVLAHFFGLDNPNLVAVAILSAFGLLFLTELAGYARDGMVGPVTQA